MSDSVIINLQLSDKTVFKQVFERYYPLLCLYVQSILQSEEDAEDVVEELFIALWLQKRSFQDQDSLRFYLYRLAKNATLNYLKATSRRLTKHEKAYNESDKISLDHSHAFIKAEVTNDILCLKWLGVVCQLEKNGSASSSGGQLP